MVTSSTKLFLKNLETLLDSNKKSYKSDREITIQVIESDTGISIYNAAHPSVLSATFMDMIAAACRPICAMSYYIMYDSNREIPVVRVI